MSAPSPTTRSLAALLEEIARLLEEGDPESAERVMRDVLPLCGPDAPALPAEERESARRALDRCLALHATLHRSLSEAMERIATSRRASAAYRL